jgi:hypothetical protein
VPDLSHACARVNFSPEEVETSTSDVFERSGDKVTIQKKRG